MLLYTHTEAMGVSGQTENLTGYFMKLIFKSKQEQEDHFHALIHARRAVFPTGKITAKELGKLSRQSTDAAGTPNVTIPGTARVDSLFSYAEKHNLATPSYTLSKAGYRLNATLVW